MANDYYVLNGKEAVQATMFEWSAMLGKHDRIVAKTPFDGGEVSTVFLGLNHAHGDGPPMLFETMIFGGIEDQFCERCSTWVEAEEQHEAAVVLAMQGATK